MTPETKDRIRCLLSEIYTLLETGEPASHGEPASDRVIEFLDANVYPAIGEKIRFTTFYTRFICTLPPCERHRWSRQRVGLSVKRRFEVTEGTANKRYIFGASWTHPVEIPRDRIRYVGDESMGAFCWKRDNGRWDRITVPNLFKLLYAMGATQSQIATVQAECKANPVPFETVINEARCNSPNTSTVTIAPNPAQPCESPS